MAEPAERVVPIVIQGQRYPVRSTLDPAYVAELAAYVDEKMRLASEVNETNDFLRVAVLAALNLADEIIRHKVVALPAKGRHAKRAEARGEQPRSTSAEAATSSAATEASGDIQPEASPAPA